MQDVLAKLDVPRLKLEQLVAFHKGSGIFETADASKGYSCHECCALCLVTKPALVHSRLQK